MSNRSFSSRSLRALASFGITASEARSAFRNTVEPGARRAAARALRIIRHSPAPVLFAGPSGAGKSTALRLVHQSLKRRKFRCTRAAISRTRRGSRRATTAVELLRGPLPAVLARLARAGLTDPTLIARPIKHYSDGQKWRLALAHAEHRIARSHAQRQRTALIADEFCAGLDLATARTVAAAAAAFRAAPLLAATAREDLADAIRTDPRWTVIDLVPHELTQGDPCTSPSKPEPAATTTRSRTTTTEPGRRRRPKRSSAPRKRRAAAKPSASSSSRARRSTPGGAKHSGPARSVIRHSAHAPSDSTNSSAPSAASSSIPALAASASPPDSSARTSKPRSRSKPKRSPPCPPSAGSSKQRGCAESSSRPRGATRNSAAPSALPVSSPGDSSIPAASSGSPRESERPSKSPSGGGRMTRAQPDAPRQETSQSSSPTPPAPSPIPTQSGPTDTTPKSDATLALPQLAPKVIELDQHCPPKNPAQLGALLRDVLGISIPARPLSDSSSAAPLDYLSYTFFEGRRFAHAEPASDTRDPTDCVVWANRGGGKTFLGAVATMLDLVFKPGIQVRILGGSLEQSKRMQEHLSRLFEHERLAPLLRPGRAGRAARSITLINGSRAEVLAASETSVRGVRVQKIRCDEVELFDPALWRAVQLTTRALSVPGPWGDEVRGGVEALSTMHLPYGIMWDLVGAGVGGSGELPAAAPQRRLFRWGLIDALEQCPSTNDCESCNLFDDCRGRAKAIAPGTGGHIRIGDARSQKRRVDVETWRSEMLCLEPRTHDLVYPDFDPRIHIIGMAGDDPLLTPAQREGAGGGLTLLTPAQREGAGGGLTLLTPAQREGAGGGLCIDSAPNHSLDDSASAGSPLGAGSSANSDSDTCCTYIAGMDFGFRAETAILIARLRASDHTIFIDHEIIASQRTMARHIDSIAAYMQNRGGVGAIKWLAADPAGRSKNDQTGAANIVLLNEAGIKAIGADNAIEPGIRRVRSRLAPADGPPRLFIHARCTRLIESLRRYHYAPGDGRSQIPAKGQFDHACDALRYLVAAADVKRHRTRTGEWW